MMTRLHLLFIAFLVCFRVSALSPQTKTVLLLHSYNQGLSWTDNLNKSIVHKLISDSNMKVDIRIEYLDTKRFESEEHLNLFHSYLIAKYQNTKFDLIISTDNPAFDFLVKYKAELPGNPPVVFCGLNYAKAIPPTFTGLMEDIDVVNNIRTILKLHPHLKKLYFIVDRSVTGNLIRLQIREAIVSNFLSLNFQFLTDFTYADLKTKLKSLTNGDVVLLTAFNFDKDLMPISYDDILNDIKPICNVPIYGVWDFYLDKGIVGGKITKAIAHGYATGDIALKVLSGYPIEKIPIKAGLSQYIFDYDEMQRFGISKYQLPPSSTIINAPSQVVKRHESTFIVIGVVFGFLLVIIGFLLKLFGNERKSRNKEKKYLEEIKQKSIQLEHALKEAQKHDELKMAFLTNMSHEIRTPLNGIVGFADLLKTTDQENYDEYITIIHSCSKNLLSIITDIVEMSLIETGQVEIQLSPTNINQIIDEACTMLQVTLNLNGTIKLVSKKPLDNNKAVFTTDKTKFQQILHNLIINALKFTEQGWVEVGYHVNGAEIEFYVKDTGIGIDPNEMKVIFERFRRGEHSKPKMFGGMGIGLSLAKSYTSLLNGKIWAESTPGKGSTFYFTLPYQPIKPVATITERSSAALDLQGVTILVCEDEINNYLYLNALLNKTGCTILWAKTGIEGVQLFEENKDNISLVLMDLKMPEMNGWEAAKLIKQILPGILVIAQTAHALANEITQIKAAGFDDYLAKPISKEDLFSAIARLLPNVQ